MRETARDVLPKLVNSGDHQQVLQHDQHIMLALSITVS